MHVLTVVIGASATIVATNAATLGSAVNKSGAAASATAASGSKSSQTSVAGAVAAQTTSTSSTNTPSQNSDAKRIHPNFLVILVTVVAIIKNLI
jgi:hypothetical protein